MSRSEELPVDEEPGVRRAVEVVRPDELAPLLSEPAWVTAAFMPGELQSLADRGAQVGSPGTRLDSLAARVAAKRAVLVALGRTDPTRPLAGEPDVLRSVELLPGTEGPPRVRTAADLGECDVLVSLSHDGGLAGALAVVRGGRSRSG